MGKRTWQRRNVHVSSDARGRESAYNQRTFETSGRPKGAQWTLLAPEERSASEGRCVAAQYQYGPKFHVRYSSSLPTPPRRSEETRGWLAEASVAWPQLQPPTRSPSPSSIPYQSTFQYVEFSGISPEPQMAIPVPNYFPRNREAYHATKCGRAERLRLLEGRERLIILGEGLTFYFYWMRHDDSHCELTSLGRSHSTGPH